MVGEGGCFEVSYFHLLRANRLSVTTIILCKTKRSSFFIIRNICTAVGYLLLLWANKITLFNVKALRKVERHSPDRRKLCREKGIAPQNVKTVCIFSFSDSHTLAKGLPPWFWGQPRRCICCAPPPVEGGRGREGGREGMACLCLT